MTEIYYDEPYRASLQKDFLDNWFLKQEELGDAECVENGIVIPLHAYDIYNYEHGVFTPRGEYIISSGRFGCQLTLGEELYKSPIQRKETVIYAGRLHEHYGHFLLESTARLWYYLENRQHKLCFSIAEAWHGVPRYAREFFDLLGIPTEQIIICSEPTQFQRVIIPQLSFRMFAANYYPHSQVPRRYYTEKFLLPFQQASKNIQPAQHRKIYLSRKKWKKSRPIGETELEKDFIRNGYEPISMETLSLREQIAVIKGAKSIAGINGTAMHNVLFSDSKPELILLNRSASTDAQHIINQALGVKCHLIKVHATPLPVIHDQGPFIVGRTPQLIEFMQSRQMEVSSMPFDSSVYYSQFLREWIQKWRDPFTCKYIEDQGLTQINMSELMDVITVSQRTFWHKLMYWFLAHISIGPARRHWKNVRKQILRRKVSSPRY